MDDIKNNPYKLWSWFAISRNPNITMDDIRNNPDKPWDWSGLIYNPFTKEKQNYIIQQYRRHLSAYRIQQHWHRIRADPRHPVGQRRLERDYDREYGQGE